MATPYDFQFRLNAQTGSGFNTTFSKAQKALSDTQKEIRTLHKLQGEISYYQKQQGAIEKCRKEQERYRTQIANVKSELQTLTKENGEHGAGTSELANKILDYEKKLASASAEEERHKINLENISNTLKEAGINTNDLGNENKKLEKSISDLRIEQKKAADEIDEYGNKSISQFQTAANILASAGIVTLLKESAEVALYCVDAYQDYGFSLAKVATLADTSELSIAKMSSQITKLSNDAVKNPDAIAEATYEAISAGVETASSVMFVEQANKLAVGGFTETATAVDVLTTALNAYGFGAENASQISDYLITTQNLGKTTVDALASSVGKVIPVAAAYGVKMDNLSTAYAIMTANGIATAETTTYLKAMLNELGDSGSNVSKTLIRETGSSFATLTEKGYSLGDVMAILSSSVKGNAGAFNELWSSSEAGIGALSIMNSGSEKYNDVLEQMQSSAGATAKAFETMTSTSAYAEQRVSVAAQNMSIAYGEVLSPAVDGANNLIADTLIGVTEFIEANPKLVETVTATAGTFGVLAGSIVAVSAAINLVKAATAGISGVGVALGIAGAAAVTVGSIVGTYQKIENTYADLTATSRKQALELDNLKAEHEALIKAEGANTYEAWRLEEQIKSLSEEYEISRQTMEAHKAEIQAAAEALGAAADEHKNSIEAIDNEHESSIALIEKLEELGNASASVAKKQALIKPIIDELNTRYENLGLTFDYVSGKINLTREQLLAFAAEEAAYRKRRADEDLFIQNTQYIEDKKKEYEDAIADLEAYEEEYKAAQKAREDYVTAGENEEFMTDDEYRKFVNESHRLVEVEKKAKKAWEDYKTLVTEDDPNIDGDGIILHYENAKKAIEDYCNTYLETSDSVIGETEAIIAQIEEMGNTYVETYQKAYDAAYESITGQFALWDNAAEVAPKSIADINNALATQGAYWSDYRKDLTELEERGKDIEGLAEVIASFADGSADSVNTVAGLVQGTDEELRAFVETYRWATEEEMAAAEGLVDATTLELLEIENQINSTIENLDLKEEAALAGKSTIEAYVEALREGSEEAAVYLNSLAALLKAQDSYVYRPGSLENRSVDIVAEYAIGTQSARSGWALVGEEGPELVDFGGGEAVYNAFETERMLRGINDTYSLLASAPAVPLQASGGNRYEISISPTFYITSEDNTPERLEEYSEIVADMVLDRLNEIGIDAKRGAFK